MQILGRKKLIGPDGSTLAQLMRMKSSCANMAILSLILCVYGEKQFSREEVEFSEEEMGPDRHTTSIQLYMPDTLKGVKDEA